MKKIVIFIFVCVLINSGFAFGASPTAVCPTGFKEIIEDGLFFSTGLSYLGTWPTNIDVICDAMLCINKHNGQFF